MTLWQYDNSYLMHYGVLGMKWGIHRAQKNKKKAQNAKVSANEWDELAKNAKARGETKAASKYREYAAKDRAAAQRYQTKSQKIEQKHKDRTSVKTYNRVKNTSTAKLIGESMVLGTYGALKYNQARASGMKRGMSVVTGLLGGTLDMATLGVWRHAEPRRTAKKKSQRRASK